MNLQERLGLTFISESCAVRVLDAVGRRGDSAVTETREERVSGRYSGEKVHGHSLPWSCSAA